MDYVTEESIKAYLNHIVFYQQEIQNNKKLMDLLRDENKELRKKISFWENQIRFTKMEARRNKGE